MHTEPSEDKLSPLPSPFTQGDEDTTTGNSDSREAQELESHEEVNALPDQLPTLLLTHGMSRLRDE